MKNIMKTLFMVLLLVGSAIPAFATHGGGEIEIEAEVEDGQTEVEVDIEGLEYKFTLDYEATESEVIDEVIDYTGLSGLTAELLEPHLEYKREEEEPTAKPRRAKVKGHFVGTQPVLTDDLVDTLQRQRDHLKRDAVWMAAGTEKVFHPSSGFPVTVYYAGPHSVPTKDTICAQFELEYGQGVPLVDPISDAPTTPARTSALCLRPRDIGFPIEVYKISGEEVLVAFNPQNLVHDTAIETLPELVHIKPTGVGVETDVEVEPETISTKVKTKTKGASGTCPVNGHSVPIGTRLITDESDSGDDVAMYCDWTGDLLPQKEDGEKASNGYECISAEESGGECVNTRKETLSFFGKLLSFFGL